MTVFSQTSKASSTGVTSRVLRFGEKVLAPIGGFAAPGTEALQDLFRSVTRMGIVNCAGRAGRLYSRDYIGQLGNPLAFPFRLRYQAKEEDGSERR